MLDWEDEVLPVLALGLVTGVAMPAVPTYFGYSREYSYILLPIGALATLVGLSDMDEPGALIIGAPILVGSIYLYIDNKRAPLPQLTNHYVLNVASIFAVAFMSGEMDLYFQPIVTPMGAGFRYRF